MTTAQRARLVVAMGLLNLILATVALTAGFVGPSRPLSDVAAVPGTARPSPSAVGPSPVASPAPTVTPVPTSPVGPSVEPSVEPSAQPPVEPSVQPSIAPSVAPSTSPVASEGPIVAVVPTPTPPSRGTPSPTAIATARPTVRPTVRPTPRPTPAPTAVGRVARPRPPCPGQADGPPGHNKVASPGARPCTHGTKGHGSGSNGMVVVLPLALGGLAATIRTRLVRGSRRLGRTGRGMRLRRDRDARERS